MIGWWIGGAVALAALFAYVRHRWPPFEPPESPECFGDWPHYHPQDAAERDCASCRFAYDCFEDTPFAPRT